MTAAPVVAALYVDTGPGAAGASVLEPLEAQLKTPQDCKGMPAGDPGRPAQAHPNGAAAFPVAKVQPFWQVAIEPTIERLKARGAQAYRAAQKASVVTLDRLGVEVPDDVRAGAARPLPGDGDGDGDKAPGHKSAGQWHAQRAAKLATPLDDILSGCGQLSAVVSCGCQSFGVPVGCNRAVLCPTCAKRVQRRMEKKVRRAMQAHSAGRRRLKRGGTGSRLDWHLVTFTCAHSGDVPEDRKTLAAAFNRWRAWLYSRTGEALPYVLVWEVTNGDDGLGHVHGHAAMLLPFVNYAEAAARWAAALGQAYASLDFQRKRDAKGRATNDRRLGAATAAQYVAKYIAKGCKATTRPEIVAQWMAAQYGRRAYSASQGFWTVAIACPCGKCGIFWEFGGIIATPGDVETMQGVAVLWRLEPPDGS